MRLFLWIASILFVFVGAFAPLIANDLPVVASVQGELRFPAFANFFGGPRPPGPEGESWKRWESRLAKDADDWAVMPFIPYGPHETHRGMANETPRVGDHYMGNDDTGRDVLARVVHGTRTAMLIAAGAVILAMLIGVPLGAAAGYWGGWIDAVLTALIQLFLCFPPIFFVLAVMAFVGNSLWGMIGVLGALYWVSFARIVRGEILSLREREFVKCARGLGVHPVRLITRHLLPVIRGSIWVNAAFVAASAVVVESTLSFLGLGPGLSTVSWGSILMQGKLHAAEGAWHLWLFPSLVLIATVTSLHSFADNGTRQASRNRARFGT